MKADTLEEAAAHFEIDADSLGTALTDGQVDAVMGSDPGPLLPVFKGKARELANNDAEEFCCSVALNGPSH